LFWLSMYWTITLEIENVSEIVKIKIIQT
jgi:hypothetical protein